MEILSKLSPAELKFLMEGGGTTIDNLLKYTFSDLLFKQVIKAGIKFPQQQFKKTKRTVESTYITVGPNFNNYLPKVHETALLKPFIKSKNLRIKFKHFINMAFEEAYGNSDYKKVLITSPGLKPYFLQGYILRLFNIYLFKGKGADIQYEVHKYLEEINKTINKTLKSNPEEALQTLSLLGGHIFLLKNLDIKLLKSIDPELIQAFKLQKIEKYHSTMSYIDPYIYSTSATEHIYELQNDFESASPSYGHSSFSNSSDTTHYSCTSGCGSSCGSGCAGCGS